MHGQQDNSRDEASVSESSDDDHENWEKADERDATTTKKVNKWLPGFDELVSPKVGDIPSDASVVRRHSVARTYQSGGPECYNSAYFDSSSFQICGLKIGLFGCSFSRIVVVAVVHLSSCFEYLAPVCSPRSGPRTPREGKLRYPFSRRHICTPSDCASIIQ